MPPGTRCGAHGIGRRRIIAPRGESGILRPQPTVGPRHAAMAVARQSQRPRHRVSRQGRSSGAAIRRHHASRHTHGCADPRCGKSTDADRLSAVALFRHRRRCFDSEGEMGRHYAYSPGLYKEAAEWLVERGVKLVGIDVQALDHPLGTFLGPHGPGPAQPHLDVEYKALTGRHIIEDFPYWEPAHKIMMTNGIPGIENIGGEIDKITGQRCTFFAFPWRWPEGEGCALRVVAVLDPKQAFIFETGH